MLFIVFFGFFGVDLAKTMLFIGFFGFFGFGAQMKILSGHGWRIALKFFRPPKTKKTKKTNK